MCHEGDNVAAALRTSAFFCVSHTAHTAGIGDTTHAEEAHSDKGIMGNIAEFSVGKSEDAVAHG